MPTAGVTISPPATNNLGNPGAGNGFINVLNDATNNPGLTGGQWVVSGVARTIPSFAPIRAATNITVSYTLGNMNQASPPGGGSWVCPGPSFPVTVAINKVTNIVVTYGTTILEEDAVRKSRKKSPALSKSAKKKPASRKGRK